jgi:hypothetical protein
MRDLSFDEQKDRLRVQVAYLEKSLRELAENPRELTKDQLMERAKERLESYLNLDEYEPTDF